MEGVTEGVMGREPRELGRPMHPPIVWDTSAPDGGHKTKHTYQPKGSLRWNRESGAASRLLHTPSPTHRQKSVTAPETAHKPHPTAHITHRPSNRERAGASAQPAHCHATVTGDAR